MSETLARPEKLEVIDLCGRVILSTRITESCTLDLSVRARGWYVIKIYTEKQIIIGKIGIE